MNNHERNTNVLVRISSNIALFTDPVTNQTLDSLWPDSATFDHIHSIIDPLVDQIGFFQKTTFDDLHIVFVLEESPELEHKISILSSKAKRYVIVTMLFLKDELFQGLSSDFVQFALRPIGDMLKVVCQKHNLDAQPLSSLWQTATGSGISYDSTSLQNVIEEHQDSELCIHVKLADNEFGTADETSFHAKLLDDIDELLQEHELGDIDGWEIGGGYRDIFCVGDHPVAMYECIQGVLKSLPAGSYVEIISDGEIRTVDPLS